MNLLEYELNDLSKKEKTYNKQAIKQRLIVFAICFMLNLITLTGEVESTLISCFSGDDKRT